MFKEIKYLIFVIVISLFTFINVKYYFSDTNKKKSFRSLSNFNDNINLYSEKIPILEDDTKDIIEYAEENNNKKKEKI
tara:strand:+ start:19 stop:252 length:234 start_codon:yes stop_codon:yes gene_type:complete